MAGAKASYSSNKAIGHTLQEDQKHAGMYHRANEKLQRGWQHSAYLMMDLERDLYTNPYLHVFIYFVHKVKLELIIT